MADPVDRLKAALADRLADPGRWRTAVASVLFLLGTPSFALCFLLHMCMEGHGYHPPYPWWHYASDLAWIGCYSAAAVLAVRSTMKVKLWFSGLVLCLCASRLVLLGLLDLPIFIGAFVLAVKGLRHSLEVFSGDDSP
jgi:hypothetical protein